MPINPERYINVSVEIKQIVSLQYKEHEMREASPLNDAINKMKAEGTFLSNCSVNISLSTPFTPSDY